MTSPVGSSSQPLRILMAAPVPRRREGGGAIIAYSLGEELERRGHSVTYLFNEDLFGQELRQLKNHKFYTGVILKEGDKALHADGLGLEQRHPQAGR